MLKKIHVDSLLNVKTIKDFIFFWAYKNLNELVKTILLNYQVIAL